MRKKKRKQRVHHQGKGGSKIAVFVLTIEINNEEHSTKQKIFAFFIMFKKLVEIRILLVMHAAQVNNVG